MGCSSTWHWMEHVVIVTTPDSCWTVLEKSLKNVCNLHCNLPPQPSTEAPPPDPTSLNSPGGSTNSLELLSPLVRSCQEKAERSGQRAAARRRGSTEPLSTHLLEQPREAGLDLMNKLLSFLLEQILTPANRSRRLNCLLPGATFHNHWTTWSTVLTHYRPIKTLKVMNGKYPYKKKI